MAVRIVDEDVFDQLKLYREVEIPKSRTGRPKSFKGIMRYKAFVDNVEEFFRRKDVKTFSNVSEDLIKEFCNELVYTLRGRQVRFRSTDRFSLFFLTGRFRRILQLKTQFL